MKGAVRHLHPLSRPVEDGDPGRGSEAAVVVNGDGSDGELLAEACRLADHRPERLAIVVVGPRVIEWALWLAGIDPIRLCRETEAKQRSSVREELRQLGLGPGYRLEVVAPGCSKRQMEDALERCAVVVLPSRPGRSAQRICRIAEEISEDAGQIGR